MGMGPENPIRWDGDNPRTPGIRLVGGPLEEEARALRFTQKFHESSTRHSRMGSIAEGKHDDPSPAACCGLLDGRVPAQTPLPCLLAGLSPVYGRMRWAHFVKGRVVVGASSIVAVAWVIS